MLIHANEETFQAEVIDFNGVAIVDFWAPWCGPCRMMGPVIEKFAEEFDGKYIVGKVNVDEEEALAARFNIMSIPTIKVFKNGTETGSVLGVSTREKLLELIGE